MRRPRYLFSMASSLDFSIPSDPEPAFDSASREKLASARLEALENDAPTISHAVAEAKVHQLDQVPARDGVNTGHAQAGDSDAAFQPRILGISKEDAWMAIRRFNLLVFRVKATKHCPLSDLDMVSAEDGQTSPEQIQAQFARLYMTVIIGLFASPSIVDATTGGVQMPPAGVMATDTTITGAPESHKGEAVEQEAHSFIASFSKLIMSITSDKDQDKSAPEDDPSPGLAKLSGKIASAKSKTDQDGQGANMDKTADPMKHAIEDFDPKPLLDMLFELIDTWERFGNVMHPTPLFPSNDSRLRLAICLAAPALIMAILSRETMIKSLELFFGFVFFGKPIIRRAYDLLDKHCPSWRNYGKLRNSVLKGVPTNAQLAITMLRVGERISSPLPPPPVSHDSPKMKAIADADRVPILGATHEQTQKAIQPDPDGGTVQNDDNEPKSKNIERFMGFIKHNSKRFVNLFHKVDKKRASRGDTHAQARLDLGQTTRQVPDAGPYRFPALCNGEVGYLHLTTVAATASVAWQSHDENLNTAWVVMVNDIADISKVDGMSLKTKHFVQWALDKESVNGLKLTTLSGECHHLDAVPNRDEAFNRLIAMGNQVWEVC
ncbi:hypothetical protein CCM_01622 [Cordyceps militaris CM01]|uniref:Uncharacterized protein n=1 Tax=Cordyceps militaris (strain CM01) TaxID=983644 RepID=G3J664_CORMM|nr:uncharacterized protein CCM_01622 [Cordyceps militaris CM01]EGX96963.1 hypothetical protein CCM_01622 [Cordyceps militaris CM01]